MEDRLELNILLVENDSEFTAAIEDEFNKIQSLFEKSKKLKKFKTEITVTRDMASTRNLISKKKLDIDALLIDLMLPKNENCNRLLEEGLFNKKGELIQESLLKLRAEKWKELIEFAGSDYQELNTDISRIRKELDIIDENIDANLNLEGGVEILEEFNRISGKGDPKVIEIPTIVITARGLPKLRKRCANLVKNGVFHWLEKPIRIEEVVSKTLKHFEIEIP